MSFLSLSQPYYQAGLRNVRQLTPNRNLWSGIQSPPPSTTILVQDRRAALSLTSDKSESAASTSSGIWGDALSNPEMCMRPGDLPAKEGEVFAIKKFKPDKEGDIQTYAGISQSAAREIMVSSRGPSSAFSCKSWRPSPMAPETDVLDCS